MSRDLVRQVVVILSVVAALTVNVLASALPINGQQTGEISDRFKVFFVPAGYVFAIWGVIYLGWIAFAVYQALPAQRENPSLRRVGWLFAASCLANLGWLFLWHYEQFVLSVLVMFVLLALLIVIYLRLEIGLRRVSGAERWCVQVPFSIYLGWITVATIANVTAALDYLQWGGWGLSPALWAVILIGVAGIVAAAVGWRRGDIAYLLVIIWSLIGIAVKHAGTPAVAAAAWIVTAAVALVLVLVLLRSRRGGPSALAPAG